MTKYLLADWWKNRIDPLCCLDDNFASMDDIVKIVAQTEKAVKVEAVFCTRKQKIHEGTVDTMWIPKSAFIYADFENFQKKDVAKIEKRIKSVRKNFPEYADEIAALL